MSPCQSKYFRSGNESFLNAIGAPPRFSAGGGVGRGKKSETRREALRAGLWKKFARRARYRLARRYDRLRIKRGDIFPWNIRSPARSRISQPGYSSGFFVILQVSCIRPTYSMLYQRGYGGPHLHTFIPLSAASLFRYHSIYPTHRSAGAAYTPPRIWNRRGIFWSVWERIFDQPTKCSAGAQ